MSLTIDAPVKPVNPLLAKLKMPGRIFQLPSRGIFYKNGELADTVTNGEVQVKPMSALDEIRMKTPDLLFSGRVIQEVFSECVPDVVKPMSLLSKDVDAIFLFLKIATYGHMMSVEAIHNCKAAKPHDYQVNLEMLAATPRNAALDDPNFQLKYLCTISTGQEVTLKSLRFYDLVKLMHQKREAAMKVDETLKALEDEIILSVLCSIESVDGNTDSDQITEWVRKLSSKDMKTLNAAVGAANSWGYEFDKQELVCKDCEAKFNYDIQLDPFVFFSE